MNLLLKSSIVFYFYCQLIFICIVCSITESEVTKLEFPLQAIVLSANNERYDSTHSILSDIGFNVSRKHPIHYKSKILDKKLTDILHSSLITPIKQTLGYNGRIHIAIDNIQDRKYFSNRLAFLNILETQLAAQLSEHTDTSRNSTNSTNSSSMKETTSNTSYIPPELDWIFLFEDDIKLHESFITPKQAMQTIITG